MAATTGSIADLVTYLDEVLTEEQREQIWEEGEITTDVAINALQNAERGSTSEAAARQILSQMLSRAGGDHPDDNLSAASPTGIADFGSAISNPEFPLSNLQSPIYRHLPRIALLWNGFADFAADLLDFVGEPYDILLPDFSPHYQTRSSRPGRSWSYEITTSFQNAGLIADMG